MKHRNREITWSDIIHENAEFEANLRQKAKEMKVRVPKHYYVPSKQYFITAGQLVNIYQAIRTAFNKNPDIEFQMSLQAWWPKTAGEILRNEIWPSIHDRINIRALI